MAYEGPERRNPPDPDIVAELRSLERAMLQMHSDNTQGARVRREGLERRLSELTAAINTQATDTASAIHTLALAVQSGDSRLAQDLAVHIATAHHLGTQERLTEQDAHLVRHDALLSDILGRLQTEDGRITAQEESRTRRYGLWTLAMMAMAALGAIFGPIAAEIVKAWGALFGGRHP